MNSWSKFWAWLAACFTPLGYKERAQRELDEARIDLLDAKSDYEYAACVVDYHENRIRRLEKLVSQ